MCAEEIVEASKNGSNSIRKDLKNYLKKWDKKYGTTYKVLEILQNIFYRNDSAREAFVEMCDDMDVQRLTFDSYLYKSCLYETIATTKNYNANTWFDFKRRP